MTNTDDDERFNSMITSWDDFMDAVDALPQVQQADVRDGFDYLAAQQAERQRKEAVRARMSIVTQRGDNDAI